MTDLLSLSSCVCVGGGGGGGEGCRLSTLLLLSSPLEGLCVCGGGGGGGGGEGYLGSLGTCMLMGTP